MRPAVTPEDSDLASARDDGAAAEHDEYPAAERDDYPVRVSRPPAPGSPLRQSLLGDLCGHCLVFIGPRAGALSLGRCHR